jgi:resolvase-like protein
MLVVMSGEVDTRPIEPARHHQPARGELPIARDTDTTNAPGRLIITVLARLAECERELIRSHCGEGIARAKDACSAILTLVHTGSSTRDCSECRSQTAANRPQPVYRLMHPVSVGDLLDPEP